MKPVLFTLLMGLILVMTASTWAASDPDLVIFYSFDKFGNVVSDESGKGHDGTIVGDVKPDAGGKRAGAAKFTKTSYLDLKGETFPTADVPSSAITLCAWAKPENTGDNQAIFNARAADQTWVVHPEFRGDGKLRWLLRTAGGATIFDIQQGQWTPDQWIHFAGVYNSADSKGILYINGEKIAEATAAVANTKIVGDWKMGARIGKNIDDARPFAGLMDDLCMFKRALSQSEIKTIMVGGPLTPTLVPTEKSLATTWGNIKN
jgi:hypothetical protein